MKDALRGAAVLLLLCGGVAGDAEAQHPPFATPDFTVYHTRQQVLDEVEQLVSSHKTTMVLETFTRSEGNYSATMRVVMVEPGGLTDEQQRTSKLRLLLNFGEHGRELVTVEVALRLLAELGNFKQAVERSVDRGQPAQRLSHLLRQCVFMVVPMENESGRAVVERGALCERKNARGVDPNRNWAVHWGFREKDYDPAEEYPGTGPFSEPEVAMMRDLAEGFRPHVWLNAHSGMEALFMPYDHRAEVPPGAEAQATLRLLQQLNKLACGGRCAVGSGGKSVGYLAHGTATDYMHDRVKVPLAFTWEIYGDTAAHVNDCFRMFNPIGRQRLEQVVHAWTEAVFMLIELLPGNPNALVLKPPQKSGQLPRRLRGQRRSKLSSSPWPIQ